MENTAEVVETIFSAFRLIGVVKGTTRSQLNYLFMKTKDRWKNAWGMLK